MRLWSIHPQYLDRLGLIALWRESLLAQKVLQGRTKGYKHHPQLKRFHGHAHPQHAIAYYVMGVWEEGHRRGYHFNKAKIDAGELRSIEKIPISIGQLRYELQLLGIKVQRRDPPAYKRLLDVAPVECHPIFVALDGAIAEWEKVLLREQTYPLSCTVR